MATRKNSNNVLFEFDSLVDLHLAVVRALQKDFPSGGSLPSINYSFLHQSDVELMKARMFCIGKNLIQECLYGNSRDEYETIYNSYLNDDWGATVSLAPITSIPKLIHSFNATCNGVIKCHILCHNARETDVARTVLKGLDVKFLETTEDQIDLKTYARVVVGDIKDIDLFKTPEFMHLAILNYGSNLQIVGKDRDVSIPK